MRLRLLLTAALALTALTLAAPASASSKWQAVPATATVTDYACDPGPSTWRLEGAWADGSVMESRTCLQYDGANHSRVRSEFRARKGGTPLTGTDWDTDAADDGRAWKRAIFDVYDPNNTARGLATATADIFNASYIVRESNWYCFGGGQQETIYGLGWDVRATPPGLPRSGYKLGQTDNATTYLATC